MQMLEKHVPQYVQSVSCDAVGRLQPGYLTLAATSSSRQRPGSLQFRGQTAALSLCSNVFMRQPACEGWGTQSYTWVLPPPDTLPTRRTVLKKQLHFTIRMYITLRIRMTHRHNAQPGHTSSCTLFLSPVYLCHKLKSSRPPCPKCSAAALLVLCLAGEASPLPHEPSAALAQTHP